jgi:ATP-dependent RNA helicase DDX54/DBP10
MKFFKELAKYTNLYGALMVGGDDMEQQFEELSKNPDVLIATPGRLVHHMVEVWRMHWRRKD